MESIGCSESIQETKHQQMTQDEQRDDIKLNGDINGSYNSSEASDNSEDGHTNGDVEADIVPSQENGVTQMDVDCDNDELGSNEIDEFDHNEADELDQNEVRDDQSEIRDDHSEIRDDHSEIRDDNSEAGDDLDHTESGNDLDHDQECEDGENEDEEQDQASSETEKEDRTLDDKDDEIVNGDSSEIVNSEAEKTVTGSVTLKTNNKDNGLIEALASGKTGDSDETNKRQFSSKELEDLTKISSRGSLEITLVKKDNDKRKDDKNDSETKEKDVLTITDTSVEKNDANTPDKVEDDDIEILSEKGTPAKKKKVQPLNITPRRSSRNLNKTKTYSDKELEEGGKSDDDIEEIIPTDPLADDRKPKNVKKTTIVVNDTKKLVEIAAGSKQRTGKKEPTLVIIDTNTITSGKSNLQNQSLQQLAYSQNRSGFSMVPVNATNYSTKPTKAVSNTQQPKQVLPSLTDDMYVVEAPSFIVPYVYEKPPITPLKQYVEDLEKIIKENDKKKKKEKQEKAEKEKSEKKELEEGDKEEKDLEKMDVDEDDKTEKMDLDDQENKIVATRVQKDIKKGDDKSEKSDTDTDDEGKDSDDSSKKDSDDLEIISDDKKKRSENYFENPLGKFFMQIGINLVQEHVQTDLLRNQKRKRDREGKNCPAEVHMAISSLMKTLEFSKENNKPYKLEMDKCCLCNFKSESSLVMAHHLETPHMRNYVYRCNFCPLEVRSPHDILFHMEAKHNVRGRLERAPAYNQCPNCPFEDNQKGKLSRHLLSCAKKYKAERNQEPPIDWEPPAKIPRIKGSRMGIPGASLYSGSLGPGASVPMGRLPSPSGHSLLASRGRGRPPIYINRSGLPDGRSSPHHKMAHMRAGAGMVYRPSGTTQPVILPSPYNLYQVEKEPYRPLPLPVALVPNMSATSQKGNSAAAVAAAGATAKLLQQPSISITPLPRQPSGSSTVTSSTPSSASHAIGKPGRPPGGAGSSKSNFVICEICDGYIKDLEQLRNHMQWIHKVKIHPKMIYNRPPLNCQKCQFRFFTDQGLERHLLGSHGLVTSSMQEAANKGKDGGRCPVCGRVYQWKLLNHVSRDHNMPLKPAHLSYKCTVCTATFGMYKQFESHVYSAHSVVAKKVMDKKITQASTSSSQSDSLLKPLKINDEITIIPQPARAKTKSLPSKNTKAYSTEVPG